MDDQRRIQNQNSRVPTYIRKPSSQRTVISKNQTESREHLDLRRPSQRRESYRGSIRESINFPQFELQSLSPLSSNSIDSSPCLKGLIINKRSIKGSNRGKDNEIMSRLEDLLNDSYIQEERQIYLQKFFFILRQQIQYGMIKEKFLENRKPESIYSQKSNRLSHSQDKSMALSKRLFQNNLMESSQQNMLLNDISNEQLSQGSTSSFRKYDSFFFTLKYSKNKADLKRGYGIQPSEEHDDSENDELKQYQLPEDLEDQYNIMKENYSKFYPIILTKEKGIPKFWSRYLQYQDDYPLLKLRKAFYIVLSSINWVSKIITSSNIYEIYMAIVILVNTVLYCVEKLMTQNYDDIFKIFLYLYIIDFSLRVAAKGLFSSTSIFCARIVDLTLIILYDIHLSTNDPFFDITPIRLFGLLIAFGAFSQGLSNMLNALLGSFQHMLEPAIFVFLSSLIFASAGMALFKGIFNQRCYEENNAELEESWVQCYQGQCDVGQCISVEQSVFTVINYNNIFYSFGQILRIGTMDGWTYAMNFTQRAFHPQIWVFYIPIIIIAGFFDFNLPVAVFKCTYSDYQPEVDNKKAYSSYNLRRLKNVGFYQLLSRIQNVVKSRIVQVNNKTSMEKTLRKTELQADVPRILSKQMVQPVQLSLLEKLALKLQSYTIQNILLPKYKKINKKFDNFKFNHLTEDEELIKVFRKFCRSNVVLKKIIDYDQGYETSSQQDVQEKANLERIYERQEQLRQEFINTQYKYVYRYKVDQAQVRNKIIEQIQNQKPSIPILSRSKAQITINQIKSYNQLPSPAPELQELQHPQTNLQKFQQKAHQIQLIQKFKRKNTPREFAIWAENQVWIFVNGVYLAYEDIQKRIKQPIAPVSEQQPPRIERLYKELRFQEMQEKRIIKKNWSGKDVLAPTYDLQMKMMQIVSALNNVDKDIWVTNLLGFQRIIKKQCFYFISSRMSVVLYELTILINTLFMALQGIIDFHIIKTVEDITTFILFSEIVLKLFVYQPRRILRNTGFAFETIIILLSILEFAFSGHFDVQPELIFIVRAFKVLLIYRCIMHIPLAQVIVEIISISWESYLYLMFFMFYMIFVCGLIGMELYYNKFNDIYADGYQSSFDDPAKGFMTIFNIMLNDDWYGVYTYGTDVYIAGALVYSFSLVFGLNYLTYGIFLALLLDGFAVYFEAKFSNKEDQEELQDQQEYNKVNIQDNTKINTPIQSQKQIQLNHNGSLKIDSPDDPFSMQLVNKKDRDKEVQNIKEGQMLMREKLNNQYYKTYEQKSVRLIRETISYIKSKLDEPAYVYYENVECQRSLFIFDQSNWIRKFFYRIGNSTYSNYLSILLICTQMVMLCFEIKQTEFQYAINTCFSIEILIKIIANGAFQTRGCYFDNIWKYLEIIYQVCYYVDFYKVSSSDFQDYMLTLVFLRPMRLFYQIQSLQHVTMCLSQSLIDIINVCFVIIVIWLVFGIFGVIIYSGKFGYCDHQNNFEVNLEECLEQNLTWFNYKHSFDNITSAVPTLYELSTFDGVAETLWLAQNSRDSSLGPSPYANQASTYIFFILYLTIGAMFCINFFTGILFIIIEANNKKIEHIELSVQQQEFQRVSQILLTDKLKQPQPPQTIFGRLAWSIITNTKIKIGIYIMLICNSVTIVMYTHGASDGFLDLLNLIYHICTIVFTIWVLLSFAAYGFKMYFQNFWRTYYLVVVVEGLVDLALDFSLNWYDYYKKSDQNLQYYQFINMFCMLRNIRIVMIFEGLIKVQRLLRVMQVAFPYMLKIFFMLVITLVIYSYYGVYLYGHIDKGVAYDDMNNFKDFWHAMVVMMKCLTQDDCRTLMTDSMQYNPNCQEDPKYCGSSYAPIYFFSLQFITNQILLNTFILSMVTQFENFFNNSESVLQAYVENIDKIKNTWIKYANPDGKYMRAKCLSNFLLDLKPPLGCDKSANLWDAALYALKFEIRANKNNEIPYNQLVYELFRVRYKKIVFKSGTEKAKKIMNEFGKEMRFRLIYSRPDFQEHRKNIGPQMKLKGNINIFQEQMAALMTFMAWKSFAETHHSQMNSSASVSQIPQEQQLENKRHSITLMSSSGSQNEQQCPMYHQHQSPNKKFVELLTEKNDYDQGDLLQIQKFNKNQKLMPLSHKPDYLEMQMDHRRSTKTEFQKEESNKKKVSSKNRAILAELGIEVHGDNDGRSILSDNSHEFNSRIGRIHQSIKDSLDDEQSNRFLEQLQPMDPITDVQDAEDNAHAQQIKSLAKIKPK